MQRENAELKRMCADLSLVLSLLKKVIEKKLRACQKCDIAVDLLREDRISIVRACQIIDLDRSMFYYASSKDDSQVEAKLNSYLENKVIANRGYQKYYKRIRREGLPWNHMRVERIYRKLGLSKRCRTKRRIPNPAKQPLIQPPALNVTWSMDFVENLLENGRKIRTLNILDDYNREGIAMEVFFSFPAEHVVEVLTQYIEWRGRPHKIRSKEDLCRMDTSNDSTEAIVKAYWMHIS